MGVSQQIMALSDDHPGDAFDIGKNLGLEIASTIAEAREKELLAEKAALIADIRACVKCAEIVVQENGLSHYVGEAYPEADIEAIIAKYEGKP